MVRAEEEEHQVDPFARALVGFPDAFLIDIKYVYTDLARAKLTWLRGKDKAKLRTAPEGLLLETYEATSDKAMSIRGEDDEERRML